jgi:hypothetical protein
VTDSDKYRREVELANRFAETYNLSPAAYDARYGVQKAEDTDAGVDEQLAKACADDPALYDRMYTRPTS